MRRFSRSVSVPALAVLLLPVVPLPAQGPTLVADLNTAKVVRSSNPEEGVRINGWTYFVASTPATGKEIYASDGKTIRLVADIYPGKVGSDPQDLTQVGNWFYFVATDGKHGFELWLHQPKLGSIPEITKVFDINKGFGGSFPQQLTEDRGFLFMSAFRPDVGRELFTKGPASSGVYLIKNLETGSASSNPENLTPFKNKLYLTAKTLTGGTRIYAVTGVVNDMVPITNGVFARNMVRSGNYLYFSDWDRLSGQELWRTGGALANTSMIWDVEKGTGSSHPADITAASDGSVYFTATTKAAGKEVRHFSAVNANGNFETDIRAGAASSAPQGLTYVAGTKTLFLSANDGRNGIELWRVERSTKKAALVKNLRSGSQSSSPLGLVAYGNNLFFNADDGVRGREPWKVTGSGVPSLLRDIRAGAGRSMHGFEKLVQLDGQVFFAANDGNSGVELWVTDAAAGAKLFANVAPEGTQASKPAKFATLGGKLLFSANGTGKGFEPHVVDEQGKASLLRDINPGGGSSSPTAFVVAGGVAFFSANDGKNGQELWKTDGTTAGTVLVKDIYAGATGSAPSFLARLGDRIVFQARTAATGTEPWISDGTSVGTKLLKDIYAGSAHSRAADFTPLGDRVFFSAVDRTNGNELWSTDGTSAGTKIVKDIAGGGANGYPLRLTALGSLLYFAARDSAGEEPWVSDGTANGTKRLADVQKSGHSFPSDFTMLGDRVVFVAGNSIQGREPWITDGTPAGTKIFKDIVPGSGSSTPRNLRAVNGEILCAVEGATGRSEPWKLSLPASATRLRRINTSAKANPQDTTSIGRRAYFTAIDPQAGRELWRTTMEPGDKNTVRIADLNPRVADGAKTLFLHGGFVYFNGDNGVTGEELWRQRLDAWSKPVGLGCGEGLRSSALHAAAPVLGKTMRVTASQLPAGDNLFVGFVGLPKARAVPIRPGCLSWQDEFLPVAAGPATTTWSRELSIPNDARMNGAVLVIQGVVLNTAVTAGFEVTNGVNLGFGK